MSIHLDQVFAYLDAHPVSNHPGDFESLLDMLHFIYTDSNPIDSTEIRTKFRKVDELLSQIAPQKANQLFDITSELCLDFERTAFSHGILAGMLLMTELNGLP